MECTTVYQKALNSYTSKDSAILKLFTLTMALEKSKGISFKAVSLNKQDLVCEAVPINESYVH